MGLVLDRPPIALPDRALRDGKNFRCKLGTLESLNLGWTKFSADWTLDGPVLMIDNFFPRQQDEALLFGDDKNIYLYDANTDTVSYLNPQVVTGTASASGTAVTGVGTAWQTDGVLPGDFITFGTAGETAQSATWFEVLTVNSETSITLTASAGTVGSGPYTIRRAFNVGAFDHWDFDVFADDGASGDDLWFATNGTDPVITWNGVDATVTLHPEFGFTCRTLSVFSNMMMYANLTYNGDFLPTDLLNSDVGMPLNVGDTGTGLAEQFKVHSGTDEILNLIPLGDYLIAYSSRNIVTIQFVGDPLVFLFRVAISGIGPVSADAIADFGDFHEFIGSDAGYLFDSVTLKETNSHIWREVLRQADPLRRGKVFGHFDEEQGDLVWSIPSTLDAGAGDPSATAEIGWTEHYLEDPGEDFDGSPFSKRDFPFTVSGFYERSIGLTWQDVVGNWSEQNYAWNDQFFQAAFPLSLVGATNGQVYVLNTDQRADGAVLPSFVRFGRRPTGSHREKNLLTRIYPFARQLPYTLDVTMFLGDNAAGPMASGGMQSFDLSLPPENHFVSIFRAFRFFEPQFGSAAGNPWVIEGFDFDVQKGGYR